MKQIDEINSKVIIIYIGDLLCKHGMTEFLTARNYQIRVIRVVVYENLIALVEKYCELIL